MGYRYKITLLRDALDNVEAELCGFGCGLKHRRCFAIVDSGLVVTDSITPGHQGTSYIHLAPGVKILGTDNNSIITNMAEIEINGALRVEVVDEKASTEYKRYSRIKTIKIIFSTHISYRIFNLNECI